MSRPYVEEEEEEVDLREWTTAVVVGVWPEFVIGWGAEVVVVAVCWPRRQVEKVIVD